jgi:hypothetical protein
MFVEKANDYKYSGAIVTVPTGRDLYMPTNLDCEFAHRKFDINDPLGELCRTITAQCSSIYQLIKRIYAHQDIREIARHKVFSHGYVGVDYLEDAGLEVKLSRLPSWDTLTPGMPFIQFDIYAYFAIAELLRVFIGKYRTDVLSLITKEDIDEKRRPKYGITQGRRLTTYTKSGGKTFNWVEMPWILVINGIWHRVRLCIYDTCAIHGVANYASFCANSGVILQYKDNFNSHDKADMERMYLERPDDFDNYALGDLANYEALIGNEKNFLKIYKSLGIQKYFEPPRLTIGSTVSKILESSIGLLFDAKVNGTSDIVNNFCRFGSCDYLKRITHTTANLNAKVDGGRCRNNRSLEMYIIAAICDIDISGCYGEGLRVQTYPLGIPVIIDYPVHSQINAYQTLREFLKKYKKELLPGLWQARVSTKDNYILECPQDYLVSWFPPKDISNLRTDSDFEVTDSWWTIDNVGETKILNNQVHHAIVTHDFIQWLDNVASQKQKKELLDNLIVDTAMYYPASLRVNSTQELINKHKEHKGVNTCEVEHDSKKAKKIAISEECHNWYGINLGELLVNSLLLERKLHPKGSSLNNLYKLCINTLYGDMVSPFFMVGNVVVGNNITARARTLAWCMEKGLHGFQTITDGCAFDMNRVLFPRNNRRITGETVVNLYTDQIQRHHTFVPLLDKDYLSVTYKTGRLELELVSTWKQCECWQELVQAPGLVFFNGNCEIHLSPEDSLAWVNKKSWQHLQDLFPGLDILHQETTDVKGNKRIGQFQFEAKGFYDEIITHGSANYMLGYRGDWSVKMRSYSKRDQSIVYMGETLLSGGDEGSDEETVKLIEEEGKKVAKEFLLSLKNPASVKRSKVYFKESILKCKDYCHDLKKWEGTEVYPGLTIKSAGLLKEFSLAQFTFQTYKQLRSWRIEYERHLRSYGQSYEMFFLNEDGTLNYQLMVETIDKAIRDGKANYNDSLSYSQAEKCRKLKVKHPENDTLELTRNQLDVHYLGRDINNILEI